ncbi:cardiolipin synthase [Aquibacillus rhizosphaerae]|uniref:Cardiolipin synthase n=1 Tax=Aquibacillus rhizosphaerae TaxID=3051431 RepID=A0ABT7LBH6_9BACI|nr:cardiolipin synthase [Aquibacillus sp. LR5S19]MDL4843206.1 cardiolipin synthase [Aquibacillus sp. LR5S19]
MKRNRQFVLFIVLIVTCYISLASAFSNVINITSFLVYLITIFSIIYMLLLENRSPYRTLLWIYVLLFVPIIGYIFFIYSGQLEVKGHLFRSKREETNKLMKNKYSFNPSTQWNNITEAQKNLSRLIDKFSNNQISFHSISKVLKNGDETFSTIKKEIEQADYYIHLEYFTIKSDQIGKEIIDLLCSKAEHGVEVRLIFDAFGSTKLSNTSIREMEKAGIEVYTFLPIKKGFFNQKLNFRNHRKIIIIDGEVGFVGGLNIGDEYLGLDPKLGFWRDTHLMLKGEVIKTLQDTFILDWNFVSGKTLQNSKYMNTSPVEEIQGGVQILPSGPDSPVDGIMSDLYYELITSAKTSILIATPYFVPNKAIRTALAMASAKGVDVKLLTPEINDSFLTKYATRSYFTEMLDYGIDVYSYKKGFLHEKLIVIDEQFATVGTANIDLRSLHLNFEINAFLFETDSIKDLVAHYKEDLQDSSRINISAYQERGLVVRTKESFARLFSTIL